MTTDFQAIAQQARSLADQNSTTDGGAVLFNVALPLLTFGIVPPLFNTVDKANWSKTAMPDEWLAAVAALPSISREGLELLARELNGKGWLSVEDAVTFVELEQQAQSLQQKQAGATAARKTAGAALLLARAEKELPGTIKRFAERAKGYTDAASGAASFALEKAVWVGKGMGAVAQVLKDLRAKS